MHEQYKKLSHKNNIKITIPDSILKKIEPHSPFSQLVVNSIELITNSKACFTSNTSETNNYTIIYSMYGTGYSIIDSANYKFDKDSIIIIPSSYKAEYGSKVGWDFFKIILSGEQCSKLISNIDMSFGKPYFINSAHQNIGNLLYTILLTLQHNISSASISYCNMLIWHVLGNIIFRDRMIPESKPTDPIEASIEYMEHNLNKELSLYELALEVGYSESHFSTIFKEKTGEAPISYFIGLKMQLAAEYLIQTNKSIKEISYILGYSSQYYFSRLFKNYSNISPSNYRNKQRNI